MKVFALRVAAFVGGCGVGLVLIRAAQLYVRALCDREHPFSPLAWFLLRSFVPLAIGAFCSFLLVDRLLAYRKRALSNVPSLARDLLRFGIVLVVVAYLITWLFGPPAEASRVINGHFVELRKAYGSLSVPERAIPRVTIVGSVALAPGVVATCVRFDGALSGSSELVVSFWWGVGEHELARTSRKTWGGWPLG